METYIYYIEILSMVSLFLLYGLSVLLMLADDGDMRWTVLLNGFALLLSFNIYQSCRIYWEPEKAYILWGILILITLIVLIVALYKKQIGIFMKILSILLFVSCGILPFGVVYSSNNILALLPKVNLVVDTKLEQYIPYVMCFMMIVLVLYIVFHTRNMMRYTQRTLDYQIDDIKREMALNSNFEEPYSRYIRDDLRNLMSVMSEELMEELHKDIVISKGSGKGNIKHQNQIMAELRKINQKISSSPQQTMPFSFSDLTSNIKHTLTTPLSQIQINCEVLKPKLEGEELDKIMRIDNYSKICLSVINAYVEATTVSSLPSFLGLNAAISEYANVICIQNKLDNVKLRIEALPDIIEGYSSNYIFALIIPLLQNALVASPANTEVLISYKGTIEGLICIDISNQCKDEVPTIDQLNTTGFSSKSNHTGVGIQSVRNLISLVKGSTLNYQVESDQVIVTIKLKTRV